MINQSIEWGTHWAFAGQIFGVSLNFVWPLASVTTAAAWRSL